MLNINNDNDNDNNANNNNANNNNNNANNNNNNNTTTTSTTTTTTNNHGTCGLRRERADSGRRDARELVHAHAVLGLSTRRNSYLHSVVHVI